MAGIRTSGPASIRKPPASPQAKPPKKASNDLAKESDPAKDGILMRAATFLQEFLQARRISSASPFFHRHKPDQCPAPPHGKPNAVLSHGSAVKGKPLRPRQRRKTAAEDDDDGNEVIHID
jgi:hypothetical protein